MKIDLRSDTVTQPTEEMRKAMYYARVGDDVYGEDPTIKKLETYAANLLNKESGLYVSSGTQGNLLAVLSQTTPGDEIILDRYSHLFSSETGALGSLAGVQTHIINSTNGIMNIADIHSSIRAKDIHHPLTKLICLENTHAQSGGRVLPLSYMKDVYNLAKKHHLSLHLDGARLFNASSKLKVNPHHLSLYSDTLQICLSKGLGAPIGSILLGPKKIIDKARIWRKALGGGSRQIGIIGAAGLIALKKMPQKLSIDHNNALFIEQSLNNILKEEVPKVESNIVLLPTRGLGITANEFIKELKKSKVFASYTDKNIVRFVTHKDVNRSHIKQAISYVEAIIKKYQ